jgi:hypothetical protein
MYYLLAEYFVFSSFYVFCCVGVPYWSEMKSTIR